MTVVCFLGASTVEGLGDESAIGWPNRLLHRLSPEVRGFNLGIAGQTLEQVAERAVQECTARVSVASAGAIVLCPGFNNSRVDATGSPVYDLDKSASTLHSMIERLGCIAPVLLKGPLPVDEGRMPFTPRGSDSQLWFNNIEIAKADLAYQAVAQAAAVPYVQLHSRTLGDARYMDSLATNDGLHPQAEGYEIVAQSVAQSYKWQTFISAAING